MKKAVRRGKQEPVESRAQKRLLRRVRAGEARIVALEQKIAAFEAGVRGALGRAVREQDQVERELREANRLLADNPLVAGVL